MTKAANKTGTISQYCANLVLRGLINSLLLLPIRLRLTVMARFCCHILGPLSGYKKRAKDNLFYIYGETKSAQDMEMIANEVLQHAGRTIIENYDTKELRKRLEAAPITGEGLELVETAKRAGTPILFVTAHFGNFEALRAALVGRGFKIGGLYRPMSNPYFNAHYAQNMHDLSGPVFEQGRRGTAGLYRHIKNGGMGVLLFDIFDWKGEVLEFLGKPAPTALSAAEIALKTNAMLVPFFARRLSNGLDFEIDVQAPVPHSSAVEMMTEVTVRLEAKIKETPEQWFWIHRRWKPEHYFNTTDVKTGP